MWVGRVCGCARKHHSLLFVLLFFRSYISILSSCQPTTGNFQHETSYLISKHQQDSLATISERLWYHLPKVYRLDARTEDFVETHHYTCTKNLSSALIQNTQENEAREYATTIFNRTLQRDTYTYIYFTWYNFNCNRNVRAVQKIANLLYCEVFILHRQ